MERLKEILAKEGLEKAYEHLTEKERKILTLYYLEGYQDKEIASYYQVSRENIFKLRKKGLTKLRKYKNG